MTHEILPSAPAIRKRKIAAACEPLENRVLLSGAPGDVLSYRYGGTGVNAAETQLTPGNVRPGSLGQLFSTPLDGQLYAEPLVDNGVAISSGPNTTGGSPGVHNVVFVATEHDSVYAIDGSSNGGRILWRRSFLGTNVAANNPEGASSITPVPFADVAAPDISPEIGITSTPVIDPATNTLYVVVKTKEIIGGVAHIVQRLHALNISDGTDRVAAYQIGDTANGADNTQIYAYGTGGGAVTDPYNHTGNKVVQFDALKENQRCALSLENGAVYVAWASHGDKTPYHGWVVAFDVSNLDSSGIRLKGVLNTSPNGLEAGIWGGGGSLAFESNGSTFYFETGNGTKITHGNPVLDANGFPADHNYYEALIKAVPDPSSSPSNQNGNGWGLKIVDYFTPFNVVALDHVDEDFGSAAPLILPASAGFAGHPHLIIASGKEGKIYVLDRDNLGKFDPTNDHALNSVPNGSGNNTPPVLLQGALSTAAYFNGSLYYTSGFNGRSYAYSLNSGTLTTTSQTPQADGYLPGSISVSADGSSNGLVWVMDRQANVVRAFGAGSLSQELWDSRPIADALVKFASPTVANGQLYVGTSGSLVVYGLLHQTAQAPNPPILSLGGVSPSSVSLAWTDNTPVRNAATDYVVEELTDGVTFSPVVTAGAGAVSKTIDGLNPNTQYFFRIRGQNNVGNSLYSNVLTATTPANTQAPNAPVLSTTGVSATSVNLSWTDDTSVANAATLYLIDASTDGVTFTQVSTAAAGATSKTISGLNPNTQYFFRIRGHNGVGNSPYSNVVTAMTATVSQAPNAPVLSTTGVTATSVNLNWTDDTSAANAATLYLIEASSDGVTFTQISTAAAGATSKTISGLNPNTQYFFRIRGHNGVGNSPYSNVATATTATVSQAPNAPVLSTTGVSATSVNLNWTDDTSAANATTLYLIEASTDGTTFTQVSTAAAGATSKTIGGLTPNTQYFFRIRGHNGVGNSPYSNVVIATTAMVSQAPNAPVLSTTGVSASSVNLNWTDDTSDANAATNYLIEASTDGTTFTQISTAAAGATSKTIAGLNPSTQYFFRIRGQNSAGNSNYSNTVTATTTSPVSGLDFSKGFANAGSQLSLNGSAAINGSALELTHGGKFEAASVFANSPIDVTKFDTQFDFQLSSGTSIADGFTFTLQGNAPTAIGGLGGALGYGAGKNNVHAIGKSVAIKFDLFSNNGEGANSTGLYVNGGSPTRIGSIDLSSSLNLHSGHLFQVAMAYDGTTLGVTITDIVTSASATQTYTVKIPAIVGANTAYVGFTAGTGALTAIQNIRQWTFSPNAVQVPNAPSALSATPATASSINLSWTNGGSSQTGFHLDRATDPAFTQNLITQTLPATPSQFTDSAAGLTPGTTFYYRLRAFNTVGDSANSNVVPVSIPLVPAAPTSPVVTSVSTNQIGLSWTDNAGAGATGYGILRQVGNGAFVNYATLPAASAAAPSTYAWTDTNLTPGTAYAYQIAAVNLTSDSAFITTGAETITNAPTGLAAIVSSNGVNVSWSAVSGAIAYNVYRGLATGQEDPTPLATVTGGTTYADITAVAGTTYYYTVTAVNANINQVPPLPAESAASKEAVSTTVVPPAIDFGKGFAGETSLKLNGSAAINGSALQLTNGGKYEAASAFATTAVGVAAFSTQFDFQISPGTSTADGFTFAIQGNSPSALGSFGGRLGYGSHGATAGIGKSIAVKFDLFNNAGEGANSTGLYVNGASPTNPGSIDLSSTLNLHSGAAFHVSMNYDGTTLGVTLTDTVTGLSTMQTYAIDIPGTVGGADGFVGFTAGTGKFAATQQILDWTFTPAA